MSLPGAEPRHERPPLPAWLIVFFSNMFFGCAGFSIVLPTLWPYLRQMNASTEFLAAVVASYSVGEGLGGWTGGWLYHRYPEHPKALLLGGMAIGLVAAASYVAAPIFGSVAAFVVLVARFASGFDNGIRQTIEQTFIGSKIPARHQTSCSSRLASCGITGIMMGPALGAPLQAVDFKLLGLTVDGNNGPGVVLLFVCVMNMLMSWRFFNQSGTVSQPRLEASESQDRRRRPPNKRGLLVCYMVFFGVNLNMASLETITPVLAQRLYGWGPCLNPAECPFQATQVYVNLLLSCGGLLSLAMAALMAFYLGPYIYRREVLAITLSHAVSVLVNLGNIDWGGSLPPYRFVLDYLLGAFFGGLARGPGVALMTQIIGPHPKAAYMGLLFAIGAVPRIVGPFLFVELLQLPSPSHAADFAYVYEGPVPRTWLLYGGQMAVFLVIFLSVQIFRKDLQPHPMHGDITARDLSEPLIKEDCSPGTCTDFIPNTPSLVREGIASFEDLTRNASSRSMLG
ncbi:mfsd8 [Symbiodinium necroappetens]|uniref:Mfsd8 protein n=2 Tax=Symbiodinium TaxID=2949 RepID=A0A812MCM2_9DINO|nr:Major facilitator superfamily domain-containing protein 8 [Symbiodinium microadriaticum]CAE7262965.1 mfsd8 [Symbiodinium necroappetens]CAE7301122.1 mfsd8 [Symbiodinium sp. KB8]CAE7818992.1 mfsd8 [Symbiodinium microadriaticum]|mmetsp:Transcript_32297/g.77161  ORF Transcript_32297/g.77161 Transcript_32297/m.77161 type:complete len:511 (+) Transcript_32297:88-1620(+)